MLGDQNEDLSVGSIGLESDFLKPKIFSHFDGPRNCSPGMPIGEAEVAHREWEASARSGTAAVDWCWGKLTEASRDAWSPAWREVEETGQPKDYCLECKGPAGCLGHTTCDTGECKHCDPLLPSA